MTATGTGLSPGYLHPDRDTHFEVETPEGITLLLRAAGPIPRALAWLVDAVLRAIALLFGAIVFDPLGDLGRGFQAITVFLLSWLYSVLWEVLRDGQTPGKMLLGLRVLKSDGTPVDWLASSVRTLLAAADFLPMFWIVGLLSSAMSRGFRRLGDWVAGTVVVYTRARRVTGGPSSYPPQAPNWTPAPMEGRALAEYSRRISILSSARAEELAEILRPVFVNAQGAQVETRGEMVMRVAQAGVWAEGGTASVSAGSEVSKAEPQR